MKNIITLILVALIACSGCKSETEHGECIGIMDDGRPELNYKLSGRNLAWSILGFEMLIPPVLWATDYAMCPTGTRTERGSPAIVRDTALEVK